MIWSLLSTNTLLTLLTRSSRSPALQGRGLPLVSIFIPTLFYKPSVTSLRPTVCLYPEFFVAFLKPSWIPHSFCSWGLTAPCYHFSAFSCHTLNPFHIQWLPNTPKSKKITFFQFLHACIHQFCKAVCVTCTQFVSNLGASFKIFSQWVLLNSAEAMMT